MWITDFIRARRWFFMSLVVTLAVPGVVLATMASFAEEMTESEALEVATVAVKNYLDENPPRQGWRATSIYVDDRQSVVVDLHVPRFEHAQVIRQRNERIQYSYLKLACPPPNAWVFEWLHGENRIWVNLHHHGDTIIKAPCPSNVNKGYLAG